MKPILSIIIPTKNRYTYLESCLRAISLNYNRPDVEIIITDNSTVKENIKALSLFSNICYSYLDVPISQVENFEFAISKASGEYITMIGDDDGLSPNLLDVIHYMKLKNKEAIIAPFVSYYWPDIVSKNTINNFSGKMFHKNYKYYVKDISVHDEIEKCLKLGGGSLCNLPRLYYGIIKKDVLNKVKAASGFYFPGPSPDMANAFSAALFTDSLVMFDAPLFIAGNSAKSAAGMGLSGNHVGTIKGNPMLPSTCHLNWTNLVPKFWSGSTIWAESLLKAALLTGKEEYIAHFNFARLYASCLIFHSEYSEVINDAILEYSKSRTPYLVNLKIKLEQSNIFILRLKFLFINTYRRFVKFRNLSYYNIQDIEEASMILTKYNKKTIEYLKKYEK